MDWSEQAESMMRSWAEAQKDWMGAWAKAQQQVWESWSGAAWGRLTPPLPFAGMTALWREMTARSLDAWFGEASPVARNVAEQILSGQSGMVRFLELATSVWNSAAPLAAAGQPWQAAFDATMARVRTQFVEGATGTINAARSTAELWSLYTQEMQKMGLPWIQSMQQAAARLGTLPGGSSASWIEMGSLYWDAYEQTLGRMMQSPTMGASREMNARVLETFDVWLDYYRAYGEYQALLAETWFEAFEQFMRETLTLAESGSSIDSLRAFIRTWADIADRAFTRLFGSDAYISTQSRMLNASMAFRIQQRQLAEKALEALDMPTRTEIDEAHRRIYELRREVRALKGEVAALKAAPQRPASRRRAAAASQPGEGQPAPAEKASGRAARSRARKE
jgi:class III poly(R)-hydroxyalkanoic acid synthase PhaE subunit